MGDTPKLDVPIWVWLVFAALVVCGVVVEALVHRGKHDLGRKSALLWSLVWITVGLGFGALVAFRFGVGAGEDYLTAFLVEKSLSVDDLFVILLVFQRLAIPRHHQHRVLQWGIPGALVTRALFAAIDSAAIRAWHEIIYVLGGLLIVAAARTARAKVGAARAGEGGIVPFMQRHLPFTTQLHGDRFVVVEQGRRVATPLLLALIAIEVTDAICAIEAVPAVFAITDEPLLFYSSNVFALLGLHSLYLVLADVLAELKYLRYGLAAILALAGTKMLASKVVHLPHVVSLSITVAILVATFVPSVVAKRRKDRRRGGLLASATRSAP
jgi:tellurite resistance protein TerC